MRQQLSVLVTDYKGTHEWGCFADALGFITKEVSSAMIKLKKYRITLLRLLDRWVMRRKQITGFCPECHQETLIVSVLDSGSGLDEWGTCHWFSGIGRCNECGWEGEYGDSSH